MAKIVINGEIFDHDGGKLPVADALWIEDVYKRKYGEWEQDLVAGSAKAYCMLACFIWRRDGRHVDTAYQDLLDGKRDLDLGEMMRSMTEADAEPEEGPTTPGQSPGPDGSPMTETGTSASSPSTSASARGKSASSRSGTSKR